MSPFWKKPSQARIVKLTSGGFWRRSGCFLDIFSLAERKNIDLAIVTYFIYSTVIIRLTLGLVKKSPNSSDSVLNRLFQKEKEEKGKPRRFNHRFWDNFKIRKPWVNAVVTKSCLEFNLNLTQFYHTVYFYKPPTNRNDVLTKNNDLDKTLPFLLVKIVYLRFALSFYQKRGSQKCKSHFNKSRECRALCSNQVEYIGSVFKFDPRKLYKTAIMHHFFTGTVCVLEALGVKEFCPILRNSGDKMAAFELKSRFCLHDLKLRFV
ncbi:hypothetical protein EGR_09781 [Echinococcus granulosus]|uniref:Uncharacterized protein n=1 Tax=Echinococcus granulosus TaxID=6210 RepID=W6UPK4_ECHGR|nr:hypothetical protein EGR_09781 [Echinococcus granulosus]EUB55344.1 hypothetical protein EGR_09781 [Echinococcus granulosus]